MLLEKKSVKFFYLGKNEIANFTTRPESSKIRRSFCFVFHARIIAGNHIGQTEGLYLNLFHSGRRRLAMPVLSMMETR